MRAENSTRKISPSNLYNYSSRLEREETVAFLLDAAIRRRDKTELYWKKMRRYYDGKHDIANTSFAFSNEYGLSWVPAQSTDGYIHVETQICSSVPDFEFTPRDKTDYDKAKQREKIVKYICDNNDLDFKNSRNERELNIYGSAAWKVCWDSSAQFGTDTGDVAVLAPKICDIYPDPTASDVDSCEYIAYAYRIHKQKAYRMFEQDIKDSGENIEDFFDTGAKSGLFVKSDVFDDEDDTVEITEWWFRQPKNGNAKIKRGEKSSFYEWSAGDIALCVLINGKEIRYIPKYWKNTSFDCFPFVIYSKIPNECGIWGKSELEAIIPLIDAKDRELAFAQLNSAYCSNDIILMEENALSDGEGLDNSPGAVWKLRPGMMGKVSRLGNMASAQGSLYSNSSYWQSLIENTTGNFEVSQGKEPSNVTTATGIALLNERAESRKNQKSIDRNAGFKRMFELIDKTSLEHYNDGRIIRLGATDDDEIVFNFGGFVKKTRAKRYIPSLDVTVHTGSAIANSKAFTVSALTSLIGMNVNEDNYKLVKAYVETIGIPERGEICDYLDEKFENKKAFSTGEKVLFELINKTREDTENANE